MQSEEGGGSNGCRVVASRFIGQSREKHLMIGLNDASEAAAGRTAVRPTELLLCFGRANSCSPY